MTFRLCVNENQVDWSFFTFWPCPLAAFGYIQQENYNKAASGRAVCYNQPPSSLSKWRDQESGWFPRPSLTEMPLRQEATIKRFAFLSNSHKSNNEKTYAFFHFTYAEDA